MKLLCLTCCHVAAGSYAKNVVTFQIPSRFLDDRMSRFRQLTSLLDEYDARVEQLDAAEITDETVRERNAELLRMRDTVEGDIEPALTSYKKRIAEGERDPDKKLYGPKMTSRVRYIGSVMHARHQAWPGIRFRTLRGGHTVTQGHHLLMWQIHEFNWRYEAFRPRMDDLVQRYEDAVRSLERRESEAAAQREAARQAELEREEALRSEEAAAARKEQARKRAEEAHRAEEARQLAQQLAEEDAQRQARKSAETRRAKEQERREQEEKRARRLAEKEAQTATEREERRRRQEELLQQQRKASMDETPAPAEPQSGKLNPIRSKRELDAVLQRAERDFGVTVLNFHASWCAPCRQLVRAMNILGLARLNDPGCGYREATNRAMREGVSLCGSTLLW